MTSAPIIFLATGAIAIVVFIWIALLWRIKQKSVRIVNKFYEHARKAGDEILIRPQSCLFRGSDAQFGNVKGNGIICLTRNRLIFEKLTGQRIEIDRSRIAKATLEESFKRETVFATGGNHLVVVTTDGNRIGFLVKNTEIWIEKLAPY